MNYVTAILRSLFGFALIGVCGYLGFTEFHSPTRSIPLIIGCAVFVVFGALIVPQLSAAVEDGGQKGFRLFSLGRRAYDGKVAEPAPKDAAP
jgi:hypothetical protein